MISRCISPILRGLLAEAWLVAFLTSSEAGNPSAQVVLHQQQVSSLEAQVMAARERLNEASPASWTDSNGLRGLCSSCGQPVTLEHLQNHRAKLHAALAEREVLSLFLHLT